MSHTKTEAEIKELAIKNGRTEAEVRDLLAHDFKVEPRYNPTLEPTKLGMVAELAGNAAKTAFDYARAVLTGAVGAVVGTVDAIIHPLDNVIYPISGLLYDATLITAGHAHSPSTLGSPNDLFSEYDAARQAISNNPQLYYDAVDRMQVRANQVQAGIQHFANAAGPERARIVTEVVAGVFVPGLFINSVKIAINISKTGIPFNPPSFHNWMGDLPSVPVVGLSLSDVRAIQGTKALLFVITQENRLIISPTQYTKPTNLLNQFGEKASITTHIHHHDLAKLSPVYSAGEIMINDGVISGLTNGSGHFLPRGSHLKTFTEKFLAKNGYVEAIGKYMDIPGFLSHNPGNITVNKMGLLPKEGAAIGITNIIANGLKLQQVEQAQQAKQQQKAAAQEQAKTEARDRAANWHAESAKTQQVIANTRCFNLPYYNQRSSFDTQFLVWKAQENAIYQFQLRYGSVPYWMQQQIRSSVYVSACYSSLSYSSSMAEFSLSLMATSLISSYNMYNLGSYMYSSYGMYGEIGGVATEVSTICDLINSDAHATADAYYLCFPAKHLPFSDSLFNQVKKELDHAFYEHKTLPFFSLHFNQNGFLYPIIHPAYQNTLIGEIIGLLDYWMKGYLNGGIFDEEFLKLWHETANCNEAYLRSKMTDLKSYCKEKVPSLGYMSLRELESRYGIKEKCSSTSTYQQPFMTSFRIIAFQEKIERHDNILVPHPSFKVEYSVDLMPDYQQYVDSYVNEHGKLPPEYQQTLRCYELFAEEVTEKMPKMPFCRDFFNLLGVINSLCYLNTTLDKMGKRPIIDVNEKTKPYFFPKSLPPIPVRYYRTYDLAITLKDIITPLTNTEDKTKALDASFSQLFTAQKVFSPALKQAIEVIVRTLVTTHLTTKLPPAELVELNEEEITKIVLEISQFIINTADHVGGVIDEELIGLFQNAIISLNMDEQIKLLALPIDEKMVTIRQHMDKQIKPLQVIWEALPETVNLETIKELWSKTRGLVAEAIIENKEGVQVFKAIKISEPAKFTPAERTARAANIAQFEAEMDKQIGLLETSNLHLSSLIANFEALNAQGLLAYAKNLTTSTTTTLNIDTKVAVLKALQQIHENKSKKFDRLTDLIQHLSKVLLSNEAALNEVITDKYTHSFLSFTGNSLTEKTGDNFQIIGGCGMSLPNLSCQPIPHAGVFLESVADAFKENTQSKAEFKHNGVSYVAYKVPVYNLDCEQKKEAVSNEEALQTLEAVNKNIKSVDSLSKEHCATIVDGNGSTLMHYAAASLNPENFAQVLKIGDLLKEDYYGLLPIHSAAQSGNVEAITKMLEHMPKLVDMKSKRGLTPLMIAIQYGHQSVMELLHAKGADFNHCLPNGLFVLYMAIQKNFTPLALWMISQVGNLDVNKELDSKMTALHLAIQSEDSILSQKLVAKGARADIRRKSDGFTAFHCAAQCGDVTLLTIMLAGGISVNLALESQKTALHLAAESGKLEAVKLLVSKGALEDAKNIEGETPLMLAIRAGEFETAKLLAEKSAINTVDLQMQTASQLALQFAMPVVADVLINRGEDPNLQNKKGFSYIYYLVRNGEYQRLKQLGNKGIALNQLFQGVSLLGLAALHGHFLLVSYLQDQGILYKNTTALSLLDYAVMADQTEFLRENYSTDKDVKSLALLAIKSNAVHCLEYLFKNMSKTIAENKELLITAIAGNNEKILNLVLKYSKDIHTALDKDGNTAVHIAVKHGAHIALPKLAESGCSFNSLNAKKQTPYHLAIAQEDADFLKRLFKFIPPTEWPRDIWQIQLPKSDLKLIKILIKYEKLLPKQVGSTTLKSQQVSKLKPQLPPCPLLSEAQRDLLKNFKACLDLRQFDKAIFMIETNPFLINIFKSEEGGALLQRIFRNIVDVASLFSKDKTTIPTNQVIAVDRLLLSLRKKGITPSHYLGKDNVLLSFIRAEKDEEACYRLKVFAKHFTDCLSILVQDTVKKSTMVQLALAKNHTSLFEQLDDLCQRQNSAHSGLHEAVLANNYELTERLLKRYSVNFVNSKGETPLMLAASTGNASLISLLLKEGALVDQVDLLGQNALFYALKKPSQAAALTLLPLLKNPNQANRFATTPLMLASAKSVLSVLRFLYESGQNTQAVDDQGRNALHHAAIEGQVEAIRYLVKQGFVVDQPETGGKKPERSNHRTALHLAALRKKEEAVLCLLELNANPEKEDDKGYALCEYAVLSKNREMLDLVKRLPYYHIKERNKYLLHAAASVDNVDVLSELIIDNVNLNAVNKYGRSALHLASITNSGDTARLLLKGFDIILDSVDNFGSAAIHYAAEFGYVRLIELLGAAGANLNQPNKKGDLALNLACMKGHIGAVTALLKQGADFTKVNPQSLTSAQLALLHGHYSIARVLQEAGDTSLNPSAFANLPDSHKLNVLLPQFLRVYREIKVSRFMDHGFYKPLNPNDPGCVATQPFKRDNLSC